MIIVCDDLNYRMTRANFRHNCYPNKKYRCEKSHKRGLLFGVGTHSSLSIPQAVKQELDIDISVISKITKKEVENLLDVIDASGDKVGLVKKVLLNKDISNGIKSKVVNRLTKIKLVKVQKLAIYLPKTQITIKNPYL